MNTTKPRPPRSSRPLLSRLIGLFGLLALPLALVVWVLVNSSGPGKSPSHGSSLLHDPQAPRYDRSTPAEDERPSPSPKGSPARVAPDSARRAPAGDSSAVRQPLALPPAAANEEAERLARFDENAASFQELVALLDEELSQGKADESLRQEVAAAATQEVRALFPAANVSTACSLSACEIELSSDEPVGTLIVRVGAFLRAHPGGAIGDPRRESEKALRIVYSVDHAPRTDREGIEPSFSR